jgi:preprotein translocase subunit SecG
MFLIIIILIIIIFIFNVSCQISNDSGDSEGGGSSFFYYSSGSDSLRNLTDSEFAFTAFLTLAVVVIFIIYKLCDAGIEYRHRSTYPTYVMKQLKENIMNSTNTNNNNLEVDLYNNNNNQNWRGFYIGSQDINSKKTQMTCHIRFNAVDNSLSGYGKDKYGRFTMSGFYNKTSLYWNKRYNKYINDFERSVHYKGTINNDIGCGITGEWSLQNNADNHGTFAMWCCTSKHHMNPGILPTYVSIPSLCISCYVNRIGVRIDGCAHSCLCNKCAKQLETCPICDTVFDSTIELINDFRINPLFDTICV